jgi:hypothetical protein
LAVPVREDGALLGDPIDVWRRMAETRAASRIGAEIVPAGVVGHQHDDVGFHIKAHELDPAVQRLAFWRVVAGNRLLLSHTRGF